MTQPLNLINLGWLYSQAKNNGFGFIITLEDDVIKNNLLLLKKGTQLSVEHLEKLLKFGISQAPLTIKPYLKNKAKTEIIDLENIKNQSALIVQQNYKEIANNIKILTKAGFRDKNIFAANNLDILEKYLLKKSLLYIFIEHNYYDQEFIDRLYLNCKDRAINIIVLNANTLNTLKKLREIKINTDSIFVKILQKPLDSGYIKALINLCPTSKFKQLLEKGDYLNCETIA